MIAKDNYLRLGVNIDHVATIRNARGGFHPAPKGAPPTPRPGRAPAPGTLTLGTCRRQRRAAPALTWAQPPPPPSSARSLRRCRHTPHHHRQRGGLTPLTAPSPASGRVGSWKGSRARASSPSTKSTTSPRAGLGYPTASTMMEQSPSTSPSSATTPRMCAQPPRPPPQ